jgi:hypothetical protein
MFKPSYHYTSYSAAIQAVRGAQFAFRDQLPAGKSSWIISASYYTCSGNIGYFLFTTNKGKEYIHADVPRQVWVEFKKAPSSGSYYDYNIKGRNKLALK